MTRPTLDLFCGAGGWTALTHLRTIGIDFDHDACRTHQTAGHATVRADVVTLTPPTSLAGLIASPPCTAFSTAGTGAGRKDVPELVARAWTGRVHDWADTLEPGSGLALEPLRWVLASRPEWTVWEQVPACLPVWEAAAEHLRTVGYSVYTAVLHANQFGCPQTRSRAVLAASRVRDVVVPTPTHQRYRKGEPARYEVGLFGEVLPWVSMAEALGWGMTERPYTTLTHGGDSPDVTGGGSGAHAVLARARDEGAWMVTTRGDWGDDPAGGNTFDANQPSWAVTEKVRSWVVDRRANVDSTKEGNDDMSPRSVDDPAPTVTALSVGQWMLRSDAQANTTVRSADEPAGKVTPAEAAALQTFPRNYPFYGTKTSVCRQIGNAIPSLLARVVLKSVGALEAEQS